MSRGKRDGESKAGPEWKVDDVWSGANPDDWEFYPPQNVPQTVQSAECTKEAHEAFYSQRRRRGG